MAVLTTQQRNTLEAAVKQARKLAETGARNALHVLAVDNPEPFAHMSADQRGLRNRLRSKARLLGDELPSTGHQQIDHLGYELAYENWHKMLFAKFLETNGLLIHPSGVAVTMEECEELAKEEGFTDKWDAAAAYASKMLPAVFRPEDPLMQISFASNDRIKLEEILDALDNYIFTADDALGWVYQFWQGDAKERINKSEAKIDGERLPAVTQLFTEPYMVHFLIDNTIGAWWVSRHPGETPPVKFEYLRLLEDGTPAAGRFQGWPHSTKEITSLDPCMGSGHFIANLFTVFVALRMYEEELSKEEATDKVILENLHGLELDARCTQIAAFNLALTAWKFCGHYKLLPAMNLACSGISPKGKKEDWIKLVKKESNPQLREKLINGMDMLYDHFQLAPELGSLLDPSSIRSDAYTANFEELQPILLRAFSDETDGDQVERGVMAAGLAKAGELLAKKYTLLITNVPYLSRGGQGEILAAYLLKYYNDSKGDLATAFLERLLKSTETGGTICNVTPQNWLFLTTYKKLREKLLKNNTWNYVARLGAGAFSQITGEVVKAILFTITREKPDESNSFFGVDVADFPNAETKGANLRTAGLKTVLQKEQLNNPDQVIVLEELKKGVLLNKYSRSLQGLATGDDPRFTRYWWEIDQFGDEEWVFYQGSPTKQTYSGKSRVVHWEKGKGALANSAQARVQGLEALSNKGIVIKMIGKLEPSLFGFTFFDMNVSALIPLEEKDLLPIWAFVSDGSYNIEVRRINQKMNVTNATLAKVAFDIDHWQNVAKEKYPNGLPKPSSDDATQWLFHGHPVAAETPLQVAVSRLLGYRFPAEKDNDMELSDGSRALIDQIRSFDELTDDDGILCIPPVNGELAASERLRSYLQAIYGSKWNNNTVSQLLAKEGAKRANLEEWLRDEFFEQHYKLFQNRPFIWQIWDGRKDGFSALVNYHKLNKENLQRLIFTYLGDWIRQCDAKRKLNESGAEGLYMAATKLKEKLEAILEGEEPYDIFLRWKPLAMQPVGWEPDLKDGVRLNIRPFITADILRKKPNIKWVVDRGKNLPGSPWGEARDNDKHLTLQEKTKAKKSNAGKKA